MTAPLDEARLRELAEELRVSWSDRGWVAAKKISGLLAEAREAATGIDALLDALSAERERADDVMEGVATAFRRTAYTAYQNTLIGNSPPAVQKSYTRMTNPVVGDWVIETSTIYGGRNPDSSDLDGVGVLEKVERERVDMEWDEGKDGPHPTETIYYIRTLDGRLFRWSNASIIATADNISPLIATQSTSRTGEG